MRSIVGLPLCLIVVACSCSHPSSNGTHTSPACTQCEAHSTEHKQAMRESLQGQAHSLCCNLWMMMMMMMMMISVLMDLRLDKRDD